MELLKLAISQLRARPFNTLLGIVMFTIGMSIIGVLMHFDKATQRRIEQDLAGVDLVVGAKGSPLQLILSTVFHADYPTGNISLAEVEKITKNPLVKKVIPIALGDNYKGYRIVGTNHEYAKAYEADLQEGHWNEKVMEVTLGHAVAASTGLKVGDSFSGVHGFMEHGHSHAQHLYLVTGILKESNSVIDRVILTGVESVWLVHSPNTECNHEHSSEHEHCDHCLDQEHKDEHAHCNHEAHQGHDEAHCDHCADNKAELTTQKVLEKVSNKQELSEEEMQLFNRHKGQLTQVRHEAGEEITSLLVFYNNPMAATTLPRMINQSTQMQAASPALELNRLMALLGIGIKTLTILAWIIIAFSAINLLVYMLNRLNQELFEVALLRALGISRFKALLLLLLQGTMLVLCAWVLSIVSTRSLLATIADNTNQFGLSFSNSILTGEWYLLLYAIVIGCLAALIPAIKAYNTNIHYLLNKL